jgi:hypothetical protein
MSSSFSLNFYNTTKGAQKENKTKKKKKKRKEKEKEINRGHIQSSITRPTSSSSDKL